MSVQQAQALTANLKFARFVNERLGILGLTPTAFMRNVYGTTPTSARNLLNGRARARWPTLVQWGKTLGVTPEYLNSLYDPLPKGTPLPKRPEIPEVTSEPRPAAPPSRPTPPVFTFAVNADGSANLRMDLQSIPMKSAMDVIDALRKTGFFTTEAVVQREEHD